MKKLFALLLVAVVSVSAQAQSVTAGVGYRTDKTGVADVIINAPMVGNFTPYLQSTFTGIKRPELYPSLSLKAIDFKGFYLGYENGVALSPSENYHNAAWWTGAYTTIPLPARLVYVKKLSLYGQLYTTPMVKGSKGTLTVGVLRRVLR
jgi:hypothetical protein